MIENFFLFKKKKEELKQLIVKAKTDKFQRNELIKEHTPFILKSVSKSAGKYITESDEEYSVGLIAFNEAIDSYDINSDVLFLSFAKTVISSRLIDYYRKEKRHKDNVEYDPNQDTRTEESSLIRVEMKDIIVRYTKILKEYGIEFRELVDISPKHSDTRREVFAVAELIAREESFKEYLKKNKRLPLKELEGRVKVSRKTLEKHRKYIIAVSLIYIEDLTDLKSFVRGWE